VTAMPHSSRIIEGGIDEILLPNASDLSAPVAHRVLNYVSLPDQTLRLEYFDGPWSKLDIVATELSELEECSKTVSFLGRTGVGKSLLISNLAASGEMKPASRDPYEDCCYGQSAGVSIYPTNLGFDETTFLMDTEGLGGRGVPEDARFSSFPISYSGAVCQFAKTLPGTYQLPCNEAEKRLLALQYDLPKLVYLMSDVFIVVGQDMIHDNVYQKQAEFLRGVGSGDRFAKPALILIRNKAPFGEYMMKDSESPKSIATTSEWYKNKHMTDDDHQFYSSIQFVMLPDLFDLRFGRDENIVARLFHERIQEIRHLIRDSLALQQAYRMKQGTLFNAKVWCRIIKTAVTCYQNIHECSVKSILNNFQLEKMNNREQVLCSFMDRATIQYPPSNCLTDKISFYNEGLRSNVALAISSVLTCLNRIEGLKSPSFTAVEITFDSCRIAAERLEGNAPCVHVYNGNLYKQENKHIVCCAKKRDHGESHHSPRYVFGARPSDGVMKRIRYGVSYLISKLIIEVGGRQACWSDDGDIAGRTTYSGHDDIASMGTRNQMRSRATALVNKILAKSIGSEASTLSYDELVRARSIVIMSRALRDIHLRFEKFEFCLGCGVKMLRRQAEAKMFGGCQHAVCGECYDILVVRPIISVDGIKYKLRENRCPFH